MGLRMIAPPAASQSKRVQFRSNTFNLSQCCLFRTSRVEYLRYANELKARDAVAYWAKALSVDAKEIRICSTGESTRR